MNSSLMDVAAAVRLSRATLRNIHENLFWAFFYNLICIPVAAGLFAWKMNPMIGAAAMSLSSFTVCMNALRLNLFKIRDSSHDKPLRGKTGIITAVDEPGTTGDEKSQPMKATVRIEGMMCEHCEANVKKALEAIDGVESALADHNANTAKVVLSKDVANEVLKQAVEAKDYKVTGIEG
jgi:Cu2+-exporting ATPase